MIFNIEKGGRGTGMVNMRNGLCISCSVLGKKKHRRIVFPTSFVAECRLGGKIVLLYDAARAYR